MSTTTRTAQPEHLGLLVAGYVMAFVLPIGGIVVAFAISEKRLGHCFALIVISVAVTTGWFLLLTS